MISKLQNMTLSELEAYAKSNKIHLKSEWTKSDIIMAIMSYELSNMTVSDLKKYAKEENISLPSNVKKEDIIKTILKEVSFGISQKVLISAPQRTCIHHAEENRKYKLSLYTICPHCGEEIYGSWTTETDLESITQNQEIKDQVKLCPRCKESMGIIEGRYLECYGDNDIEMLFQKIHQTIIDGEHEIINSGTKNYIEKCKQQKEQPSDNSVAVNILASTDSLKQYILYLINMESEIYLLTERIATLNIQNTENELGTVRAKTIISEDIERMYKAKSNRIVRSIEKLNEELKTASNLYKKKQLKIDYDALRLVPPEEPNIIIPEEPKPPVEPTLSLPVKPQEPVYKQPGLFNKKKISAENEEIKKKYESQLAEYNLQMQRYNTAQTEYEVKMKTYIEELSEYERLCDNSQKQKKQYETDYKAFYKEAYMIYVNDIKEKIKEKESELKEIKKNIDYMRKERLTNQPLPQYRIKLIIDEEIKNAKEELKKIVEVRNNLYSYNVIYGKYRNYVALSSLYEYLDSGRCKSLDGPDGAYNLLESEARANEIILQLTTISSSLEDIKNNQYMLYRELKKTNHYLSSINTSMNEAVSELITIEMDLKDTQSLLGDIRKGIQQNNNYLEEIGNSLYSIKENGEITAKASVNLVANTAAIQANTATTAHYSAITAHFAAETAHYTKVNAELTNALGFMIAMK